MEKLTTTQIVEKLIGNVTPYGASHIDEEGLENLKEMCNLTYDLIEKLNKVAKMKDRQEESIKVMGEHAYNFLEDVADIINE